MAALGAYFVFFPVYLVERGLELERVGLVITCAVTAQLVSGVFWGALADRSGRTKPFLIQALLVWAAGAAALPRLGGFAQFLALGVARSLLAPMMEGLIVARLFRGVGEDARGSAYSGFAVWGSLGWAAGVAVAGLLARGFGTSAAFYLAAVLFAGASVAVARAPEGGEPEPLERRGLGGSLGLLWDRRVVRLLLSSFPLVIALNAASQFFPVRLREVGASAALIGLVYMVPSLLEVPVFLALGRRSDRWRDRRPLLLWASGVYAAMFLFISAAEEPGWLFWGYSLLAPLAWAPFVMGAFTLMAELVPPRHWATGQTLLSLWLWGVGGILGPLCGGFLAQRWGLGPLFSGLSVGALLSGAMFIGLPRGNRAP